MTKRLTKSKSVSATRRADDFEPDYPLQGSSLDVPLDEVLTYTPENRHAFIRALLKALAKEIKADNMALKARVPFKREMRDLRKLLYDPVDAYLFTDDKTFKRNVLGKGSPGGTHTFWSRRQMWKMETKAGDLRSKIVNQAPSLVKKLDSFFDVSNTSKQAFRKEGSAVQNALRFLQYDHSSGSAFPPFHARFFADKFLPKDADGIVVDPCAGWGGRLLGTLLVPRKTRVTYYGIDPNKNNKHAYEGLIRRVNVWLKRELPEARAARIFYKPFEDWIQSAIAKKLKGKVDLVLTSPPYFSAENYDPASGKQSANRYKEYEQWREHFYKPMFAGVRDLLKPGGVFVLNVANVSEAPKLESDARKLAKEVGLEFTGFYKLALTMYATARGGRMKRAIKVRGKLYKYEAVFVFTRQAH